MSQPFEVLVVGSGPAGIAAAVSAAELGIRVGLIDENPNAGGQIWRSSLGKNGPNAAHDSNAARWCDRLSAARIVRLQGWSVFDQPSRNILRAERGGEVADFEFEKLILATGARERFLPFPGWTLPNVMGVGAIQAMIKGGLPVRGKRVVIAGSGPLLLAVAASLKAAGATVLCICEQATLSRLTHFAFSLTTSPRKIVEGIRYRSQTLGTPFHASSWPVEAIGEDKLTAVKLSIQGAVKTIHCDYLACGFHLVPNIELPSLIGCTINEGNVAVDEWQQTSIPDIYCAGEPTGIGGLELSLIEGQIAGLCCANEQQEARALVPERNKLSRFATRLAATFVLRDELKALAQHETLVCRCEDVAFGEVCKHGSWRTAKLHTRCGMGPCQGRVCGSAIDFLLGWNVDSVRPPVLPALISSLASSRPRSESENAPES